MNLAVVGSRTFNAYNTLKIVLDEIKTIYDITCVVSGGADGTDKLSEKWAKENNIKTKIYLPDWDKFGKSAGFIRNKDIWDNSDFGVAFWDGNSKGTSHSFGIAKKQNKELFIFNYITNELTLN